MRILCSMQRAGADCSYLVSTQSQYWRRAKNIPPEPAALPSPRTAWTAGRWVLSEWCRRHNHLAATATKASPSVGTRVVFLGDSILENWELKPSHASAVRSALAQHWPLVLAQGGDQTQHLLWHLEHAWLTRAIATDPLVTFVPHIGTNNIGNYIGPGPAHSPAETHRGLVAVATHLLQRTRGRVLLTSLLPRGDVPRAWLTGAWLCVARCNDATRARRAFGPAIERVNRLLQQSVLTLAREYPGRIGHADCSADFRNASDALDVRRDLMPDGVHPTATGSALLAACFARALVRLGWHG